MSVRRPTQDERATGAEPLTQFGRMCATLGIKIIPASSPQAKGRIERNHGTYGSGTRREHRRGRGVVEPGQRDDDVHQGGVVHGCAVGGLRVVEAGVVVVRQPATGPERRDHERRGTTARQYGNELHQPGHGDRRPWGGTAAADLGGEPMHHLLMAASVTFTLPCIFIFFLAQRYFVRGIVLSGVKG